MASFRCRRTRRRWSGCGRDRGLDALALTALHDLVTLPGSLILGWRCCAGGWMRKPPGSLPASTRNLAGRWGCDDEADEAAANRLTAMRDAERFYRPSRKQPKSHVQVTEASCIFLDGGFVIGTMKLMGHKRPFVKRTAPDRACGYFSRQVRNNSEEIHEQICKFRHRHRTGAGRVWQPWQPRATR